MLNSSSRLAFAAFLHDLGKFAERAGIAIPADQLESHKLLYCPFREGGYYSHVHAAYTGLAMDLIERFAPDLIRGEATPFASMSTEGSITDSLINAAAAHHKPDTFLQWVIATADRVASGFEREEFENYNRAEEKNKETGRNHYQARQLTLFEQINREQITVGSMQYRYPLKALSASAIFPVPAKGYEPSDNEVAKAEYARLWQEFLADLDNIPKSHRNNWALWLDHFDTAWQSFTHAIPSATAFGAKPDVSLYDHSKTTAALATALWRWHDDAGQTDAAAASRLKDRSDWNEKKFLLVQGDFFGIQDFIFADGSQTNKNAARLLRGRSFQVSLFTELAALKVLEACELPATSQIINAAGKFLIVAPNTDAVKAKLKTVRIELNQWFAQHSFGQAGIGLVGKTASCNDFLNKGEHEGYFKRLMAGLFADLERAKLQRLDLDHGDAIFSVDYPLGECRYNDKLPADQLDDAKGSAAISRDQIKLGTQLTRKNRILIARDGTSFRKAGIVTLETAIFGYQVAFTESEEETGRFGELASNGQLLRCWDFSLPQTLDEPLFHGYARRYINAYVPTFSSDDDWTLSKYPTSLRDELDDDMLQYGAGKTLNHIACEDRTPSQTTHGWQGQVALMTLKGDVDNLGLIFQQGLSEPTFAKMAALSRQMNAFFAVYLPALCATEFKDSYTVFAGGDDFFLIGPWRSTQKLATRMAEEFKRYVAANPDIHFSAGMVMSKPGLPMHTLAAQAEEALESAKANGKNAVVLFGERIEWAQWQQVEQAQERLHSLSQQYNLSTGYIYGMLNLIDLSSDTQNTEHAMWRSRFAYRTRRYVVDKLKPDLRQRAQTELASDLGERGIGQLGTKYRIPLFNFFYAQR